MGRTPIPQDDVGIPSGQPLVTSGVVDTNGVVSFDGLVTGDAYWAIGRDPDVRWRWLAFKA